MVRDAIGLLVEAAPEWVSVTSKSNSAFSIITAGKHPSGEPLRQYCLSVAIGWRDAVLAREVGGKTLLPSNCTQRHMNTDGSFCIGHGAPWLVVDQSTAAQWWGLMLGYLQCQDIAAVTRKWPPNRGLSHGDAAAIQLEAEAIADRLGVLVQYREAIEYGAPWPPTEIPTSDEFEELMFLERLRRQTDQDFMKYINYPCCGTMDDCPIAVRNI